MALLALNKIDAVLTVIERQLSARKPYDDGLDLSENDNISCKPFGVTSHGQQVLSFTLQNKHGMQVQIINYGGHIRALRVPSKTGEAVDVTIGLDTVFDYEYKNRYFGSIVGRYANRICGGTFLLNGKRFTLPINNGPNSLHGGVDNFSKQIWKTTIMKNAIGLSMVYQAKDGEEGYPGTCDVTVEYVLSESDNTLNINYRASTDTATIINLTNHAYWNLNGDFNPNGIANASHLFQLNCDYFTPVDATSIPLGSLQSVINTPFDFSKPSNDLGARIAQNDFSKPSNEDLQLKNGNGFDHNFVVNGNGNNDELQEKKVNTCAVVTGQATGIQMTVSTDQPGVQLYTGNFLNGTHCGKGKVYDKRCAFCLETQHFPDSPNHKTFPSTVLKKGETFKSTTRYAFGVVNNV